jgi:hypothetical protein
MPEGETRRGTESAAKTGCDRILGGLEAKLTREPGVGASDRLARLEQGACGVEKYGVDQEMGTVTEFRLSLFHWRRRRFLGGRIAACPPKDVAQDAACGDVDFGRLGVGGIARGAFVVGSHRSIK